MIFIDQDSPAAMYGKAGLDSRGIVATAIAGVGAGSRDAVAFARVRTVRDAAELELGALRT